MIPTTTATALNGLISDYARHSHDPDRMREGFHVLQTSNTDASAVELQLRALSVLPRCDSGTAAQYVIELLHLMPNADPLLAGALLRQVWVPGQDGFPLLPDPRRLPEKRYRAQRDFLASWLNAHTRHHRRGARRLLCDQDLAFFDDLPGEIVIYRGTAGVGGNLAAAGLSWTTNPYWARCFAEEKAAISGGKPVVVAAWVTVKPEVITVFAEAEEIVAVPRNFRVLPR